MTLTVAELQQSFSTAQALFAAASDKLGNLSADGTAIVDVAGLVAMIDPALAPEAALAPVGVFVVEWIAANNKSGTPGSQMAVNYGRRGSDPNLPTGEPAT